MMGIMKFPENEPYKLKLQEWKDIMQVPEVREVFNIDQETDVINFRSENYAARFSVCIGLSFKLRNVYVLFGYHIKPIFMRRNKFGELEVTDPVSL
jgi:hypothetical protein